MRRMTVIACVATLGVAVATYGVLDAHDKVPGILTIDRDPSPLASPAPGVPSTTATDGSQASRVIVPTPLPPVATSAASASSGAPQPAAAALRSALAPALADLIAA